jgi:hypothetical protein
VEDEVFASAVVRSRLLPPFRCACRFSHPVRGSPRNGGTRPSLLAMETRASGIERRHRGGSGEWRRRVGSGGEDTNGAPSAMPYHERHGVAGSGGRAFSKVVGERTARWYRPWTPTALAQTWPPPSPRGYGDVDGNDEDRENQGKDLSYGMFRGRKHAARVSSRDRKVFSLRNDIMRTQNSPPARAHVCSQTRAPSTHLYLSLGRRLEVRSPDPRHPLAQNLRLDVDTTSLPPKYTMRMIAVVCEDR